jgi:SAM-dependent methyltransferase
MTKRVDLYRAYSQFTEQVFETVRQETFGQDIGQNSWITVEEYDRFISWLDLKPTHHVLEVASGSGGPALYLARRVGCRVTGIDASEDGIATASQSAIESNQSDRVVFKVGDANARLPLANESIDALLCIDALNHLPNRSGVLAEWRRILRPGRRAVFTDPVVITGPVSNEELALRSSIGSFLFVPPGLNARLIRSAGFDLVKEEDVTESAAVISGRWHAARQRHKEALLEIEGEQRFAGLQEFLSAVHRLSSEKRLSRVVYLIEKRAG